MLTFDSEFFFSYATTAVRSLLVDITFVATRSQA